MIINPLAAKFYAEKRTHELAYNQSLQSVMQFEILLESGLNIISLEQQWSSWAMLLRW